MVDEEGQSCLINGLKVQFPAKPYPSQRAMMYKILQGLDRRQNCLLESPTGSGKSLALLCASLAWQAAQYEKVQAEEAEEELKVQNNCTCGDEVIPDAGSDKPTNTSDHSAIANQMIPPSSLQTPTKGHQDVIIEIDLDDDFKLDAKKFRTPGSAQVVRVSSNTLPFAAPETLLPAHDARPSWKMEVTNHTLDAATNCTHCVCEQKPKQRRKVPKIYFGTRTHKQIAQLTHEMAKTAYRHTKMSILSSRQHTCIDPVISLSSTKNEDCKSKLEHGGCRFSERVRRHISHGNLQQHGLGAAWDLEDFVGFCKSRGVRACPYFGVRQLREEADIVFCPYNYLIDPIIRNSMEISLKNEVVILDEAHNIEDAAREAASFSVSQRQLGDAMADLHRAMPAGPKGGHYEAVRCMVSSFHLLIEENQDRLPARDFHNSSRVWTGANMAAQLSRLAVGPQHFSALQGHMKKMLAEDASDDAMKLFASSLSVIEGLFMVLGFIYRDDMKYLPDYRIALVRTMTFSQKLTNGVWLSRRKNGHQEASWTYMLHFWCLNPAVAFSDIGRDAHCIVVTSGTLSPMSSFESELEVTFPIQLQADHVVSASQVWVGAISEGPGRTPLVGTFQTAESFVYQDDVGGVVLRVCQTVPFGVLCFLPSYAALDRLVNRWKSTGLWSEIGRCKRQMCEPRGGAKVNFDDVLKAFYDEIRAIEETPAEVRESSLVTGVLFLAVCRGKVSEGLDFTDNNARAVIAIGIPFPNVKDIQVDLKKEYNNKHAEGRGLLRGGDWYEVQAFRALNQALGRCIRHRLDWGALILVDARFGRNPKKYSNGLSRWVRQKIQYFSSFSNAHSSLQQFTEARLKATTTGGEPLNNSSMCGTTPSQNTSVVTPHKDAQVCLPPVVTPALKSAEVRSASPEFTAPPSTGYSQAGGFLAPTPGVLDLTAADGRPNQGLGAPGVLDLTAADGRPNQGLGGADTFQPVCSSTQLTGARKTDAVTIPAVSSVRTEVLDDDQTLCISVADEVRACSSPELFTASQPLDSPPMSNDSAAVVLAAAVSEMLQAHTSGATMCVGGEAPLVTPVGKKPLFRRTGADGADDALGVDIGVAVLPGADLAERVPTADAPQKMFCADAAKINEPQRANEDSVGVNSAGRLGDGAPRSSAKCNLRLCRPAVRPDDPLGDSTEQPALRTRRRGKRRRSESGRREEMRCHGDEEMRCHGDEEMRCHGDEEMRCHGDEEMRCHGDEEAAGVDKDSRPTGEMRRPTGEEKFTTLQCAACRSKLVAPSVIDVATWRPPFITDLLPPTHQTHDVGVYVMEERSILPQSLTILSSSVNGVHLNSQWSDGCCIQYLCCRRCSEPRLVIGATVTAVTQSHDHRTFPKQVWILAHHTILSSAAADEQTLPAITM